jgi:hypothetical protein
VDIDCCERTWRDFDRELGDMLPVWLAGYRHRSMRHRCCRPGRSNCTKAGQRRDIEPRGGKGEWTPIF